MSQLTPKQEFALWVVIILLLALVGLLVLAGLRIVWRWFQRRQENMDARRSTRPESPPVDVWQVSGRRLTGTAQRPRHLNGDPENSDEEELDRDDDDENYPGDPGDQDDWWRRTDNES